MQLKWFTRRGGPALKQNGVQDGWLKIVSYQSRPGSKWLWIVRPPEGLHQVGTKAENGFMLEITPEFFERQHECFLNQVSKELSLLRGPYLLDDAQETA